MIRNIFIIAQHTIDVNRLLLPEKILGCTEKMKSSTQFINQHVSQKTSEMCYNLFW